MTSHFMMMALFALLVSIVFATLLRDDVRSQMKTAGWMFGAFMVAGVALSWLMYPLPL
jgi:4-amino-4-deoxy-L-arabinose transferase-like glycosyltransferase